MTRLHLLFLIATVAACRSAPVSPSARKVSYPDGSRHYEYQLRDGIPHGAGRVWHPNGQLKSIGEYVNGVKHGRFEHFTEGGDFEHQAYFYKGTEVWRSTTSTDEPPPDLLKGLRAFSSEPPRLGGEGGRRIAQYESVSLLSSEPPAPYFATMDRTTGLSRIGVAYGMGNGPVRPFGSVSQLDLFANYRFERAGVYGRFAQARFEATPGMVLSGRRTAEVGGTLHAALSVGDLSLRGGLLVPIGNDDDEGFLAASAASWQRPTDAAATFASTVAMRTGASLTRSLSRLTFQADAGVDWLAGGDEGFDALVRANAGVGIGIRSLLLGLELTNAVRVSDASRRLHVLGLSGTFWMEYVWLTMFVGGTADGTIAITGSVGYEL